VFPGSKHIKRAFAAGTLGATGAYSVPSNPLVGVNGAALKKRAKKTKQGIKAGLENTRNKFLVGRPLPSVSKRRICHSGVRSLETLRNADSDRMQRDLY